MIPRKALSGVRRCLPAGGRRVSAVHSWTGQLAVGTADAGSFLTLSGLLDPVKLDTPLSFAVLPSPNCICSSLKE